MNLEYKISRTNLIVVTSIFLLLFTNLAFIKNMIVVYPVSIENSVFLLSLIPLFVCVNIILFSLICFKRTIKPVLIVALLISSLAAYFMDTYNVIIDDEMIDNIVKTDTNEALDLFSIRQLFYFLLLGVIPSFLIYRVQIIEVPLKKAIFSNLALFVGALLLFVVLILSLSNFYASFFREHKILRYYANPSYYVYSSVKYVNKSFKSSLKPLQKIGLDAHIQPSDDKRKLIVFVAGETARADHFSLNGYNKKTNPLLEKEAVINFANVSSCGTSTAYSLPCMFSIYGRSDFSKSKAKNTENILDILKRVGVNVVWLDNNSGSQGVADRIVYQDYKSEDTNPVCDIECRDEGMLAHLQDYIDSHPTGDIFIVLHQMGNHGPAYYKRYPEAFEQFTPICKTNQLEQCSQEEISNTYDNVLLYTDYFLSQTINFLKTNDNKFETVLFYNSDHGESLGENNLYLHGLPYMIAPKEQTHVPMIMWFGDSFGKGKINFSKIKEDSNKAFSHDNIFHTILGLLDIQTELYNEKMDIIRHKYAD